MRPDGTRVEGLTPIMQALPYIMPRRYDAQNWASDYVDEETLVAMEGMADLLKYSLIVVATVPILCAYPFIQKYFVKGIMIGSLKG